MKNKRIEKIRNALLDALFPIHCFSCQKEGIWICPDCLAKLETINQQVCPVCESTPSDKGTLCFFCKSKRKSNLDGLITAVSFENIVIKKMIHTFKYRFVADLAKPLADVVSKVLKQTNLPLPDIIIPVPLHQKRLRWRGFNQSLLLAKHISEEISPLMEIEVLDILERKRNNFPQMEIKNYHLRQENVRDIFQIKTDFNKNLIKNKRVLLVDDVATTGSTLQECAKILKMAGTKKVFAAVISRQSLKK